MSKACSLFSGSSGNSIYVGCGDNQILVDIGVSARSAHFSCSLS